MDPQDPGLCPHCQSPLEPGYVGFSSGLFWTTRRLKGWQSVLPVALSYGRYVVGNLLSTPWLQSRAAHRCTSCGALVLPTDA